MPAFLSARWEHLILASHAVPPELLEPRLPPGVTLDFQAGRMSHWARVRV